ncbi:MAG: hypothetical protein ABW061_26015 [Polyangiaceae bacterium]
MARRELSAARIVGVALGLLALCGCRRGEPRATPTPAASAAASASSYVNHARASHFDAELTRARARWQSKVALPECASAVHEKDDLELCRAAQNALTALEQDPEAPLERALPELQNSAISLARLSKRLRYLAIGELSKKRLEGDAGGAAPPAAAAPGRTPPHDQHELGHARTLELGDGPISQLMSESVRLERDVLRNLGAYLEYGELPVRRSAFATVKRLHEQHAQWPLLTHLLQEASLLESDPDLKSQLVALSASGLPSNPPASHSAASK